MGVTRQTIRDVLLEVQNDVQTLLININKIVIAEATIDDDDVFADWMNQNGDLEEGLVHIRLFQVVVDMKLYAQLCEACVFCEDIRMLSFGWCKFHNIFVELERRCGNFIPKRKYKHKVVFYIPEGAD